MAAKLVKWVMGRLRNGISHRKKDGIHEKILNINGIAGSGGENRNQTESNGLQSISGFPDVNSLVKNAENAMGDAKISPNTESLLENPKVYKTLIFLLVAILKILLVVLVIVTHLYSESNISVNLCTSEECLRSAANLKLSLDPSLDPCNDFYKYTCGRWSAEHPNHGWFTSFSSTETIEERILFETEYFLQSKVRKNEPKPVKQARDFYKSCMDAESMDDLSLDGIYKYLKRAELPLVPSFFTKSQEEHDSFQFDVIRADAMIKKIFAMDVLIGFNIDSKFFNNSENVIYMSGPTQKSPLSNPGESNANVIRFVLKKILTSNGDDPEEDLVEKAVDILLEMFTDIDKLVQDYPSTIGLPSPEHIKSFQNETNQFLIDNERQEHPGVIELYLEHLFENSSVTVDFDRDLIYLTDNDYDYLMQILYYALNIYDIDMELFMWWKSVYPMIINTSNEIKEYVEKETSTETALSHSFQCAKLVNKFMSMAVSYGIADRSFTNTTKPKIDDMVENIKETFVEEVKSLSWMDEVSKNATLEKSKEMRSLIGYPDWLFENGSLERYYEGLVIKRNSLLDNMMEFVQHYMPEKLESLRKEHRRHWPDTQGPTEVNAFNYLTDNAMIIPLAILYFPMYHLGLEVLNYGAMGSLLGHELTHGFDNDGRKYDKYGNYKQWWTNDTIEIFEKETECFANQYENITIEGVDKQVDGYKALGEVLADNGGLNEAYRAYKKLQMRDGFEANLPGFENFTHDQLFFIAFASTWCETISKEDVVFFIENDEHPPSSVRVLGAVQNSPYFADAFKCPLGSKMNPNNKCQVW